MPYFGHSSLIEFVFNYFKLVAELLNGSLS